MATEQDQLDRSLTAVHSLIENIRDDQWSAPTPCDEWPVRRVVQHLDGMNKVFAAMLAGQPPPERSEIADGDLARAFRDSSDRLLETFAVPGILDRSFQSPMGTATGRERLMIRMYDLLAHGWDVTRATGQPPALPEDAAEAALAFAHQQVSDASRPGRFAPPQPTPDDAPAIDRLAAYLGRPLDWS